MTSSPRLPSRARLGRLAAALLAAGLVLPLTAGSAAAQLVPAPSPSPSPSTSPAPADLLAPTFTVTPTEGVEVDGTLRVTFSEPVTGVDSGTLRLRSTPSTVKPVGDGRSFLLKAVRPLYAGARYVVEASPKVVDAAGNGYLPLPVYVMASPGVDDRSAGLRLLGSWSRLSASGAFNGSYVRSVPTPTRWSATHTDVYGSGAEVWGCVGPANGILEVWADGRRLGSVDTYSPATSCDIQLVEIELPTGLHMVEVRGTGQKRASSRGTALAIDAVIALP